MEDNTKQNEQEIDTNPDHIEMAPTSVKTTKSEIIKKDVFDYDEEEERSVRTQDSLTDPYTEPDPKIPGTSYVEPVFLSRGCNRCPESYKPISETELSSCCKLDAKNWMKDIRPTHETMFDIVEVRFKNNRKEFFRLPDGLEVVEGDVVAVEGAPGHDVGIVSMTGELCRLQIKKRKIDISSDTIKRLFRRAKKSDIEKWAETIQEENRALLKTRKICDDLKLQMKINDVEIQGDHSKAIFYYTAEERVDFRNLIKVLAEEFKVRVEMKQIGIRQEAGKVGGIGTCGRELCCCTWLTNFQSVTTNVAKTQQILPNPQKLAGQCGKLKCCLNFEYDVYVDALKNFPPANTNIRTKKGLGLYRKTDVLRGLMWYSYEGENDMYAIPAESVREIIEMNSKQQYPEKLEDYQTELMSASALIEDINPEYEMELRMLADTTDSGDSSKLASDREDQNNSRRSDNGNRRNNTNGNASRQNNGHRSENKRYSNVNAARNTGGDRSGQNGNRNQHEDNKPNDGGNRSNKIVNKARSNNSESKENPPPQKNNKNHE